MFELYSYGDTGPIDHNNPFYYMGNESKKILLNIGRYRQTMSNDQGLIDHMLRLNMIRQDGDHYNLCFPFFLKEDVTVIKSFADKLSKNLFELIKYHEEDIYKIFENQKIKTNEILYHFIGCDILDGTAIDHLHKLGYLNIGKTQLDERNYLLIGFEETPSVTEMSQKILCSCNVYNHKEIQFKSFGDAVGQRNDFYRLFRQVDGSNASLDTQSSALYKQMNQQFNDNLISRAARVIQSLLAGESHGDEDLYKLLESLEYVKDNQVIVPVFGQLHKKMFDELSSLVVSKLEDQVKTAFECIGDLDLVALKHDVNPYEIANELWHQVFGALNELLVADGLIKPPKKQVDGGRYLKAIYLKEYYDKDH